MPRSEPELVALVAAGDDAAYGELYRRHLPMARRRAYHLAHSRADAEDLVSDAFLCVLHAIRRGARPNQFRAYLGAALRTSAYRLMPPQTRYGIVSLDGGRNPDAAPFEIPAPGADPAATCDTAPIRDAFRSLPARWRVALWLSAVEGRAPAELATILDLSGNGAAALTCRARRGLLRAHTELNAPPQSRGAACRVPRPAPSDTGPRPQPAAGCHRPARAGDAP